MDLLPAGLMEQILDDAKHDTRTLLACLRVCIAWHSFLVCSPYEPIRLRSSLQLDRVACAARIYPATESMALHTHPLDLTDHILFELVEPVLDGTKDDLRTVLVC